MKWTFNWWTVWTMGKTKGSIPEYWLETSYSSSVEKDGSLHRNVHSKWNVWILMNLFNQYPRMPSKQSHIVTITINNFTLFSDTTPIRQLFIQDFNLISEFVCYFDLIISSNWYYFNFAIIFKLKWLISTWYITYKKPIKLNIFILMIY